MRFKLKKALCVGMAMLLTSCLTPAAYAEDINSKKLQASALTEVGEVESVATEDDGSSISSTSVDPYVPYGEVGETEP